jgi:hypothetical protein
VLLLVVEDAIAENRLPELDELAERDDPEPDSESEPDPELEPDDSGFLRNGLSNRAH